MDPLAQAPEWLLRPLPVNAAVDPALHARIDALAQALPSNLPALSDELAAVVNFVNGYFGDGTARITAADIDKARKALPPN